MIQVDKLKDRGEKMEEMVNKFRDASDCIFFCILKGKNADSKNMVISINMLLLKKKVEKFAPLSSGKKKY